MSDVSPLEAEVAPLIVRTLTLQVDPAQIRPEEPLFGALESTRSLCQSIKNHRTKWQHVGLECVARTLLNYSLCRPIKLEAMSNLAQIAISPIDYHLKWTGECAPLHPQEKTPRYMSGRVTNFSRVMEMDPVTRSSIRSAQCTQPLISKLFAWGM